MGTGHRSEQAVYLQDWVYNRYRRVHLYTQQCTLSGIHMHKHMYRAGDEGTVKTGVQRSTDVQNVNCVQVVCMDDGVHVKYSVAQ